MAKLAARRAAGWRGAGRRGAGRRGAIRRGAARRVAARHAAGRHGAAPFHGPCLAIRVFCIEHRRPPVYFQMNFSALILQFFWVSPPSAWSGTA